MHRRAELRLVYRRRRRVHGLRRDRCGGSTLCHATRADCYIADESYGAYVTGTLTLAGATMTASSGSAEMVRGVYANAVALSDGGARLTAEAPEYVTDGTYTGRGAYGVETPSALHVTEGRILAQGAMTSIKGTTNVTAPVIEGSDRYDGSDAAVRDYHRYWEYAVLDATRAVVTIADWSYGNTASEPSVLYDAEGVTVTKYEYTARGEEDYGETVPKYTGDYTLRVTLSNGVTGTADFSGGQLILRIAADMQVVTVGEEIETGVDKVTYATLPYGDVLASITLTASGTGEQTLSGTITPSATVILDADDNDVTANYKFIYLTGHLYVRGPGAVVGGAISENTLDHTVENAPEGGARLLAAWYGADGRMLGTASAEVDEGVTRRTLTVEAGAAKYKLMLVDKTTLAPLCKPAEITGD